MTVAWQQPPPRGRLVVFVEKLQKRPGKWALVGSYAHPAGGTRDRLRKLGCEVTGRNNADGRIDIYARVPQ